MAWLTDIPDVAGVITGRMVGTVEGGGTATGSVGKGGAKATTVTGVALPKNATVDVSFVVAGMDGTVTDVLVGLHLIHSNVGDLELRLLSPLGTSIVLFDNRGGNGDNLGSQDSLCVFDDTAAAAIAAGVAPFTGSFRPESPFTGYDGEAPNGTWKVRVINTGGQDGTMSVTTLLVGTTATGIGAVAGPTTGQLWPR